MAKTKATYARLDEMLRSLDFTAQVLEGKARIYKHATTGAAIYLPDVPLGNEVLPHHLGVVRTVLKEYDIADPTDFASQFQKAS